ncbi:hypothetical protein J3055_001385 [Listeria monocytogenes]|uniref:hypothetical protein n=1 Tax=Listeria monocytogenes TaxID=1639 RepID=UPI0007617510|nr:hypothetical protein [Listeria monocytogenes]EAA0018713.1 hypothetical protein [Listeria monocytogenes]EAA0021797.1 hypothetical protein [Listeria monocytogenes]EAA0046542.1 hypothetical protein [Listeria monocytogenes]EAA0055693.1 hypothetical protein [Listeria monocytogenes]EAA0071396.1 hypothetical protein [Listeria monocytogenes]
MLPVYLLFGFQVKVEVKGTNGILIYLFLASFLIITISMMLFLKKNLNKRYKDKSGVNLFLTINRNERIIKKNGDILAFLMGTIIPSILIIEEHLIETLVVFISLQFLIFILTTRSSTVFPNILLILVGVNIYELDDGKYILVLGETLNISKKSRLFVSLGDSEFCNTYLIAEENDE